MKVTILFCSRSCGTGIQEGLGWIVLAWGFSCNFTEMSQSSGGWTRLDIKDSFTHVANSWCWLMAGRSIRLSTGALTRSISIGLGLPWVALENSDFFYNWQFRAPKVRDLVYKMEIFICAFLYFGFWGWSCIESVDQHRENWLFNNIESSTP